ncbi:MAG: collagen-like protein [Cyanobacteria bacterium Co-bin13]|nr:collagen-like protein [Cyanobacteria bacterium Co-bin13]
MLWNRALGLVLFAGLLSSAGAVPLGRWVQCAAPAWAFEVRSFGTDGSAGRSGRDGQDGRSGTSQSVTANGSPINLNLAGEDGSDGESGERGGQPSCGFQPRDVRYNLEAANGGSGGSGGRGGHGGEGGSLQVYYADPNALRQISVDARGGRGGRGGTGGQGVAGCWCDRSNWSVRTCTGTPGAPDYSCIDEHFSCRPGRSGSSGSFGRDGENGQPGQLRLVNQLDPLPPEVPSLTRPLADLVGRPVQLSKNLWDVRTGAAALLAPGSAVRDEYLAYRDRVEGAVQIDWQAPRALTTFATAGVTAAINEQGNLGLSFSEEVWIAAEPAQTDSLTTFTVTAAVRASDATRLAWGTSQGSGRDLALSVVDLGQESAYLNTQFWLTLRTSTDDPRDSRRPRYTVRYEGWVPEELITREGDRFVVALGRLPISQQALRSGTLAQVELRAVRSLADNSAEQNLSWQGTL